MVDRTPQPSRWSGKESGRCSGTGLGGVQEEQELGYGGIRWALTPEPLPPSLGAHSRDPEPNAGPGVRTVPGWPGRPPNGRKHQ